MDGVEAGPSPDVAALRAALKAYVAERSGWPAERRSQIEEELADLLVMLVRLADRLNIDVFEAGSKLLP